MIELLEPILENRQLEKLVTSLAEIAPLALQTKIKSIPPIALDLLDWFGQFIFCVTCLLPRIQSVICPPRGHQSSNAKDALLLQR